jgi:catechol 2,3-dioxygenase-like lactoylglutathione lyase family enzyme
MRLHHVQVACPPGGEDAARRFYGNGLGMTEVDKPADLVARGGCWFRAYDDSGAVAAELHVGVEDPFAPARKAARRGCTPCRSPARPAARTPRGGSTPTASG